jgi:hypothetical protein
MSEDIKLGIPFMAPYARILVILRAHKGHQWNLE